MLPNDCVLRTVRCGGDGTAVITTDGVVMTCGRNSYNKLGLADSRRGLFSINFKVSSITIRKRPHGKESTEVRIIQ